MSAGTCAFLFRFEYSVGGVDNYVGRVNNSVGCVRGVCSGIFYSDINRVQLWRFYVGCICTNMSRVQRWLSHWIILAPKVLIFPPNFKIGFIAIVLFWPCRAHSDRCFFAKKMIRRRPMGYILRTSDSGSGDTKDVDFIWCVDGQEPQLHKMWCLGLDNVTREIQPTAQLEVGAGTVGQFTTN